jgi:hypothetical protein
LLVNTHKETMGKKSGYPNPSKRRSDKSRQKSNKNLCIFFHFNTFNTLAYTVPLVRLQWVLMSPKAPLKEDHDF